MKYTDDGPDMQRGGLYRFRGDDTVLKYIGKNWSGNGYWHQFEKVSDGIAGKVWAELLDADLRLIVALPMNSRQRRRLEAEKHNEGADHD